MMASKAKPTKNKSVPGGLTPIEFRRKLHDLGNLSPEELRNERAEVLAALDATEDVIEYADGEMSQKAMYSFYLGALEKKLKKAEK